MNNLRDLVVAFVTFVFASLGCNLSRFRQYSPQRS